MLHQFFLNDIKKGAVYKDCASEICPHSKQQRSSILLDIVQEELMTFVVEGEEIIRLSVLPHILKRLHPTAFHLARYRWMAGKA